MIERLIFALGVSVALWLAWLTLRRYLDRQRRALLAADGAAPAADSFGVPTLLYLYAARCGQCRQQSRAVEAVAARLGDGLRVRRVDALAEPALAERYRVWTVPATVVLDVSGRARAVNYGLASAEQLEAQLRGARG